MTNEATSDEPIQGCRTTKIYCRPDCPAGKRMSAQNRVRFRSTEEARSNGYRACKICKPDGPNPLPEILFSSLYKSPIGTYTMVSSEKGVVCLASDVTTPNRLGRLNRQDVELREDGGHNRRLIGELDAYFAGELRRFTVPLDMRGTPFQRRVWELLSEIPYGETRTYGQLAEALGRPKAARAVGRANATNPVAIVVP
jgi:methylated-DNA-[protein]-cysteine S-methyltransferase